jgi:hypothetical protein
MNNGRISTPGRPLVIIIKNEIYVNPARCDLVFFNFTKIVEHKCVEDPQ